MKKRKIVIGVCFFVLLTLTIAIPIIDYNMKGKITNETILKSFVLLIGDFLFLIRNVVSFSAADKKSFAIYESEYEHIIGKAFKQPENKRERTKLLKAIHLYNQNKFNKSIERLEALFSAGYYEDAVPYAEKALEIKADLHPAASCLAMCYCALGDEEQCSHYSKIAISNVSNSYGLNTILSNLRIARNNEINNEDNNNE